MSLYLVNPTPPDAHQNPAAGAPPLASDTLATCVENPDSFNHVRAAVFSKFTPAAEFDVLFAESTASALWLKARYANISSDLLDIRIQEDWKIVTKAHPGATPRYRTAKAFEALHQSGLLLAADGALHRAHSRLRGDTRDLAHLTKK